MENLRSDLEREGAKWPKMEFGEFDPLRLPGGTCEVFASEDHMLEEEDAI